METNRQGFLSRLFSTSPPVEHKRSTDGSGVIPPSYVSTVKDVTLDNALGIPTVYACVDIITTGVMQLSLDTYRGTEKIDNPMLVQQPDANRSLAAFLERTAFDLAAVGNAYWKMSYKTTTRTDVKTGNQYTTETVNNLEVLDPLTVSVSYNTKGVKIYRHGDKDYTDKHIKHLRNTNVPGHLYGVGPIQACREMLSGSLALRDYANNWLQNSGVPTGTLETAQELSPDIADAYKQAWHKMVAQGGIAVLDRNIKFSPILMSAADIQFIESTNLTDLQIARAFRIDPAFLALNNTGSSVTYGNRRDLDVQLIRWTLKKYLIKIQDAMSECLPRGTRVEFNVKDFLDAYEAVTPEASNQTKETAPAQADAA